MVDRFTTSCLVSTFYTEVKTTPHLEHEFHMKERAIMEFNKQPTINDAIEILAKTDPIIRYVWDHYQVKKQTTPISPTDVEYFWKKTTECFGNIIDMSKPITPIQIDKEAANG